MIDHSTRTNARVSLAWLIAAAMSVLLAGFLIARLRGPEQSPLPPYWPTQSWRSSTPEEQGVDSAALAEALLTIREKNIPVHSLLLIRNGSVVVDAYFYPYEGTAVHDLASVTKSLMTTLIGIADQGKLQLDRRMVALFADRRIDNRDGSKDRITIRHLASMSSGLDCTSERDEATLKEMQASGDWVQFVLDRKVKWEPGTHFVYCSPGMHLLSAILQRATGSTALEFAREHLFAPLAIRDIIWPADPQGVTRGWGDARLHPRDVAKLGYLWLHKGVWEGKRIVSGQWVEMLVTPQITMGDDYYGYGWWVSTARQKGEIDSYRADGRGGQYVVVVPELSVIVATTGGGFTLDDIAPLLLRAFVDVRKALPANPVGVARLEAAVAAVRHAPRATPVVPLPSTARAVSGKTFAFEANPTRMASLRLNFNDSDEATVQLRLAGSPQIRTWPLGLDGVFRMSAGDYDHPQGLRGHWADTKTFVLEYDGIPNNDHITFQMRFERNRVVVEAQETAHELGVRFEGRLQNP